MGQQKVKKEIKAVNNVRQVRVRNGSRKVKHGSKRSKMCQKKSQNATLEPDWRCGETTGKKNVQSGDTSPPNVTRGKNVLN